MGELEDRQRKSTTVTPVVSNPVLQATPVPGKVSLADLDPDVEVDGLVEDDREDGIVLDETPDDKSRSKDRATIQKAEQRLVAIVENERRSPDQRKAALRDLICAQRGIDYAKLPAGDQVRSAIDTEVETRFADIVQRQRDKATRAKLGETIDNTKLSREARLAAFYQEFLLDRGIRDIRERSVDEQQALKTEFDATGAARFALRDELTRDNKKQRAIAGNRKNPAKLRLEAYRQLFKNQYAAAAGTRLDAMTPAQQATIEQRFQAEIVPQFEEAEQAAKKRADNLDRAKALEPQLRPTTQTKRFAWGTFKSVIVPNKEDVYREILVLRSGLPASHAKINAKVAVYRKAVAEQNAASKKALSATYYFDRGYQAYTKVTKADIQKLWPSTAVQGVALADAMFPAPGQPMLIAPSQQTPILIRAGAILYGGETEEVAARLVARGTARISDLTAPIVLLTPEVMQNYLGKVLLPAARQLMKVDDQAALMEAVLVAYKADMRDGKMDEQSFDAQMKTATTAVGWKPVTTDGAPIDLGDKNSQGATVSWKQAMRMNEPIEQAQAAVDEQQKLVDEIRAAERKESERRQKEQLDKLAGNPRLRNLVGGGPGYTDPRRAAAEAELEKRKAVLARRKEVQGSFTQQAMDLKTGAIKLEDVQLDLGKKLEATNQQIQQYLALKKQAELEVVNQEENARTQRQMGGGGDGQTGANGGMAIVVGDARRKVTELGAYISELEAQRTELQGYVADGANGALPPPIVIAEMNKRLETGYRFVPSIERWGRAVLSGAEEAGAFVMRVFAGLVDVVSIPGIIENGGNQVLSLLGSDARLNFGVGWATSNIRDGAKWLETNAEYQMQQTGGGFEVELIKGLTMAAILYLPTMGFASVGAAVGGAIRATQMAKLLGTSVSLGSMGVLATLDKGPADMARAALPMAALPMFGAAFKSVGGKLVASFFSNTTTDILVAADYGAAINVLKNGGNMEAAIAAAGKSVNWSRALAQGFLGVAQEAQGIVKTQKTTTLAEDGMPILVREAKGGDAVHEYYRFSPTEGYTKVDAATALAQAAKQSRPPVRVSEAELGAIKNGGDGAMQTITVAENRSQAVDNWGQLAAKKEAELASVPDGDQRTKIAGELERAKANEDMLRLAEKGADLDPALVAKAGQAPVGYTRDATSGVWRFSAEVQAKQIAVKNAELTAIDGARAAYERNLAELYTLKEQLRGAAKSKKQALEAQITQQSQKVRTAQETYLAVGGDPSIVREVAAANAELAKATTAVEPTTAKLKEIPTEPIPEDAKPWTEADDGRKIFRRKDETFVDQNGRRTDSDGMLIDKDGNWIDSYGRRVDSAGRLVDADYNLIDERGQRIDRSGKRIEGGEQATLSERETIAKLFRAKFGEKTIAYRGIRVPTGTKVIGDYQGGSKHGQMIVFDAESALHYARTPAFEPPGGAAAADEIVIIQFEITAEQIVKDTYGTMEHVFVDTDITKLPGYREARIPRDSVTDANQSAIAAQVAAGKTTLDPAISTTTETVSRRTRAKLPASSLELPPPDQRPPNMDSEIIAGIARRGEDWANNIMEGTCASAAMKNTISAQIAGFDAYVMEFDGLTRVGRTLERFGLLDSGVAKVLEKCGVETRGAHAIAAIRGTDGAWRYLSWGRVEASWEVFAREAYGESYALRGQGSYGALGTWSTGDHVRWMVAHKWEYPHPKMGKLMRMLGGWQTVGK